MITKTHVKAAVLSVVVIAVIARSPARDYVLGDEKFLGLF
jgi:hypothetical protein